MSRRLIAGGIILLVALSVEAVNVQDIKGPAYAISALSTFGVMLYLLSSFMLYSRSRFALMHVRWQQEGASVSADVQRALVRASWMTIIVVVGVAALLPRSYGMGLLDTFQGVLGVVAYVFMLVGYVFVQIFTLLALALAWVIS